MKIWEGIPHHILQIVWDGKVCGCRNEVLSTVQHSCCIIVLCGQTVLHRGIIAISLEKFRLIDPQKPWNFSTSNNLQFKVYHNVNIPSSYSLFTYICGYCYITIACLKHSYVCYNFKFPILVIHLYFTDGLSHSLPCLLIYNFTSIISISSSYFCIATLCIWQIYYLLQKVAIYGLI